MEILLLPLTKIIGARDFQKAAFVMWGKIRKIGQGESKINGWDGTRVVEVPRKVTMMAIAFVVLPDHRGALRPQPLGLGSLCLSHSVIDHLCVLTLGHLH
jgi:hypothetical protein